MPEWESFDAFLREANRASSDEQRQQLVDTLLRQRPVWPWIKGRRATFVFSKVGTQRAAVNLDTIKGDPPFAPMDNLPGTTLWHVTLDFQPDDLLDYMLAIDDPMTPLKTETDLVSRVSRYWQIDPLNPLRMQTTQLAVSVLQMPHARPFADWQAMPAVPRGLIHEHTIRSRQLGFDERRLWVYTPPGYDPQASAEYPLLILLDAQWCLGPLQVPAMADALIKHRQLQPLLIAMMQSGNTEDRAREFIANDRHYLFMLTELLPFVQSNYRVNPTDLGVGGVGVAATAAIHAGLMNPTAFTHLIMISPPLHGRGGHDDRLNRYLPAFEAAEQLPRRIFQSVGRYELGSRFLKPARSLAETLRTRRDVDYRFVEVGSGHGLVGFKGVFPEALAWTFPQAMG
jgi:enterochelin esterase-like enzyme